MLAKTLLALSLITGITLPSYSQSHNIKIARQPEIESTPAQTEYRGIVKTVDDIAEQITVRIDNLEKDVNGSGVIIAKQGNTYYGLTAKHVLCTLHSVIKPQCEPNGTHQIVTSDGAVHQLDYQTVEANGAWLDIAIFSFKSDNNYEVATINAYSPDYRLYHLRSNRLDGFDWIFVSGFPQQNVGDDGKPARLITGGRLWEEEQEEIVVKETASLAQSKAQGQDGLVYSNLSYPGMSGGAVLDSEGRLIGINTGAENELYFDEAGDYDEYSLGFSLGEAITDFLGYLQSNQTNLQEAWLSIDQNPAKYINMWKKYPIVDQLLTAEPPQDETDLAAWMNYGNQLWRYGRFGHRYKLNESVAAFERVIALDPNFDKAYYAKGLAHYELREYEQGVDALLKATQIDPNPYYYWRWLGASYRQLEQWSEAIAAYDKALENNKNQGTKDFVLYLERGNVLRESQNYPEAITSYNEAIKINPQHPGIYLNRGLAYHDLQKHEQAIADYNKAIKLDPQYAIAYNNRANTYGNLQQHEQAIADYSKAINLDPQYVIAYNNRANTYGNLQQYEQAIADYSRAINLDQRLALAYNGRNFIIADYDRAIDLDLQLALDEKKRRYDSYGNWQKYEQAIADYSKAIEINPQDAIAYNNRGFIYSDWQKPEQAIADYSKAIEINPQLALAYYNLGVAYTRLKNIEEARTNLEKARQLFIAQNNPVGAEIVASNLEKLTLAKYNNNARFYYDRAHNLLKKGDTKSALRNYTQAIQIEPQFAEAYNNRGFVYYSLEQHQQAIGDYTQALQINPNSAQAYNNRGVTYADLEQYQQAISDFTQAIEINPNFAQAYAGLGFVYTQLNNIEEARTNLEKAQQLFIAQNNTAGAETIASYLKQLP